MKLLILITLLLASQIMSQDEIKCPICDDRTWAVDFLVGKACWSYVEGFDITGVTNKVTINNVMDPCVCVKACLDQNATCTNWVWKFTSETQKRSCTLYSNFNLPSAVTIQIDTSATSQSADLGEIDGNPQGGGAAPMCFENGNDGKQDTNCRSGYLFQLSNNKYAC